MTESQHNDDWAKPPSIPAWAYRVFHSQFLAAATLVRWSRDYPVRFQWTLMSIVAALVILLAWAAH